MLQELCRLGGGRGLAAALDCGAKDPEDVLDPLTQPCGCPPRLPQARGQHCPLVGAQNLVLHGVGQGVWVWWGSSCWRWALLGQPPTQPPNQLAQDLKLISLL